MFFHSSQIHNTQTVYGNVKSSGKQRNVNTYLNGYINPSLIYNPMSRDPKMEVDYRSVFNRVK